MISKIPFYRLQRHPFWHSIVESLVQFHGYEAPKAFEEVYAYYLNLRTRLVKRDFELIYHEEPFAVACEIAKQQLNIAEHMEKYEQILMEAGW